MPQIILFLFEIILQIIRNNSFMITNTVYNQRFVSKYNIKINNHTNKWNELQHHLKIQNK